jgi:hypothetical protein
VTFHGCHQTLVQWIFTRKPPERVLSNPCSEWLTFPRRAGRAQRARVDTSLLHPFSVLLYGIHGRELLTTSLLSERLRAGRWSTRRTATYRGQWLSPTAWMPDSLRCLAAWQPDSLVSSEPFPQPNRELASNPILQLSCFLWSKRGVVSSLGVSLLAGLLWGNGCGRCTGGIGIGRWR